MIPQRIREYLDNHAVMYETRFHRRAVAAQDLAAAVHVPGRRVAKSVLVKAGEQTWMAVLPATEVVDEEQLAAALGVSSVRLLGEPEFAALFPECEAGAEPPFGGLFGLPVIIDATLAESDRIVFRGGSHEEAIEMRFDDFRRMENEPVVAAIGRARTDVPPLWHDWPPEPLVP